MHSIGCSEKTPPIGFGYNVETCLVSGKAMNMTKIPPYYCHFNRLGHDMQDCKVKAGNTRQNPNGNKRKEQVHTEYRPKQTLEPKSKTREATKQQRMINLHKRTEKMKQKSLSLGKKSQRKKVLMLKVNNQ